MVRSPGVSYATHLALKMDDVKRRSSKSQTEWLEFTKAMKELAIVEENYGKGLRRVAAMVGKLRRRDAEFYGVADALEAVRSNLNHSGEMHTTLGASVLSDMVTPLVAARSDAVAHSKQLAQRAATQHKHLRMADEKRKKAYARANALAADAAASKDALADLLESCVVKNGSGPPQNDDDDEAPQQQQQQQQQRTNLVSRLSMALGNTLNSTSSSYLSATPTPSTKEDSSETTDQDHTDRLEELREKAGKDAVAAAEAREAADAARDSLAAESRTTVLEAQRVLTEFQEAEESGISELRDSLRKLCVFVSSALSNRHYDLQSLARVIDDLEPEADIERFVRACVGTESLHNVDDIVDASTLFTAFAPPTFFPSPSKLPEVESNPTLVKLAVLPPVATFPTDDNSHPVAKASVLFDLIDKAAQRDATLVQVRLVVPEPPPEWPSPVESPIVEQNGASPPRSMSPPTNGSSSAVAPVTPSPPSESGGGVASESEDTETPAVSDGEPPAPPDEAVIPPSPDPPPPPPPEAAAAVQNGSPPATTCSDDGPDQVERDDSGAKDDDDDDDDVAAF